MLSAAEDHKLSGGRSEVERTVAIRRLNDAFRQSLPQTKGGDRLVVTAGLGSLTIEQFDDLLSALRTINEFSADNDPHGEHDFGAIEFEGERYFWKIDYCDSSLTYGSPDPADPNVTARVMTLMLASQY